MTNYTFLELTYCTGPSEFFAINTNLIGPMMVSETYDNDGHIVDSFEGGDGTCKGFNYLDGDKWASIIVDFENEDAQYQIIDDQELIEELLDAIETKGFVKDSLGKRVYKGGNFQITYRQGSWESYSLIPLLELED